MAEAYQTLPDNRRLVGGRLADGRSNLVWPYAAWPDIASTREPG